MADEPPVPSFLASRVAKAKKDAAAKAATIPSAPKPEKQPKPEPKPEPAAVKSNVVALVTPKASKPGKKDGCDLAKPRAEGSRVEAPDLDRAFVEAVEEMVARTATGDPATVELLAEHMPAIVAATLVGAKVPGLKGNADRMTVFRIMGLPWTPAAKAFGAASPVEASADAADRLTAALNRVERRISMGAPGPGHNPVTVDADLVEDALPVRGFEG
jgi:pyruvate/2-oxoglutarate dehydrogenase complex dihydrolipoamide acyltransferase (E2) component